MSEPEAEAPRPEEEVAPSPSAPAAPDVPGPAAAPTNAAVPDESSDKASGQAVPEPAPKSEDGPPRRAEAEAEPAGGGDGGGGGGWGWGSATALSGWGWSTLTAAASSATTLTKKLEDIVLSPGYSAEEDAIAQALDTAEPAPGGFWNTEEMRFLTTIASGTVSVTTRLADKGLEALGSGIETGISTVTQVLPLAVPGLPGATTPAHPDGSTPTDSPPSLAELAAAAEATLATKAPAAREAAAALGQGLADDVQAASLPTPEEARCAALAFGEALVGLEGSAKADCAGLETAADAGATLTRIAEAAASAGAELTALTTAHLALLACAFDAGADVAALLPLDVPVTDPTAYAAAGVQGLRLTVLFALTILGRICAAYSGLATQLAAALKRRAKAEKTKEAEELAARARAVKGEVYVLQGRCTAALMEPLEQVLTVLRAVSLRETLMDGAAVAEGAGEEPN